jgi:hypothetical protein
MLTPEHVRIHFNSRGFRVTPGCPHCKRKFKTWSLAKMHVKYCRKGSTPRKSLRERSQQGRKEDMSSFKNAFKQKGVEGPPLLHGTDIPKGKNSVTIIVKELREAPDNFGSIAIIDLEKPVHGCEAWAVNKTNVKALLEKFGLDEDAEFSTLAKLIKGKKITLAVVAVNNPQTRKMTRSLFVA